MESWSRETCASNTHEIRDSNKFCQVIIVMGWICHLENSNI